MLDHLHYLSYPQRPITPERFRQWLDDPCTKELKKALVIGILDEIGTPLPSNFDQTVIGAHQREGAMSLFERLMDWEPESVKTFRETGKPVEGEE